MDETMGRIPPQSLEAEQSVLGSVMLDRDAILAATEFLVAEDFYAPAHQEIFSAMVSLYETQKPIDLVTVLDELTSRGSIDGVGGLSYLTELSCFVPSSASVKAYVEIVREKAVLRKLIHAAGDIQKDSYEGSKEVPEILSEAEKAIFDISMNQNIGELVHVNQAMLRAYDMISHAHENRGRVTGLSTGFTDLDFKTTGFHPAELILIAARPSMGKTSFAMNIVQHIAIHQQKPVAVFSLEMAREQLITRIMCAESNVDAQKVRSGQLNDDEWMRLTEAMVPISLSGLYIDDSPGISVPEIRSKCRRLKIEKGLSMVIIDYLQLMSGDGKKTSSENRQQEISAISRSLKIMARELDVPVVALSQLSRAPDARTDHRPMLSDLRESGAIEQDADVVMFLYRDHYYDKESPPNIAELNIAKQRNGPTGAIDLIWQAELTRFSSSARQY